MKLGDGRLEAVPADEPHRVIGPAVLVLPQAVDRDDPRVLQSAGHLGLEHEPLAVLGVVGMPLEDLLERHLAMQLFIVSHEDGPQPSLGMGSDDPVSHWRDDQSPGRRSSRILPVVARGHGCLVDVRVLCGPAAG